MANLTEPNKVPAPGDGELVIISLLMRLYDVQMALLSKTDPELADKIYDAHDAGETFNPAIFSLEMLPKDEQ